MNTEAEIHAINTKLGDIVVAIGILKERRVNDKESVNTLADEVDKLAVAVNRLNLTLAESKGKADGISTAVKTFRILFGGLIFVAIVSSVTFMWNVNDRVTALEILKG